MAEALKRLGGGRWETKDGRFAIEPESGTWVVVDNEQTDELGLALVRGPFPSLTAAREAIDEARGSGPQGSPLAERLERARSAPAAAPGKGQAKRSTKATPKVPDPPPEPKWLRDLPAAEGREARALIAKLEKQGVPDAEAVARAEVADEQPALARLALERALADIEEDDPDRAVRAAVDVVLTGRDAGLGAAWHLVDGNGREIRRIDVRRR